MKKILLGILVAAMAVSTASATPNPNSAVLHPRVFNDCPSSVLTSSNMYPGSLWFNDEMNCVTGWANLHTWRLSEDGVTAAQFMNGDCFRLSACLTITGDGNGEAGLQISPWWSPDVDGRFNVRVPDGEVACFGGRLPFYSFTGSQGLRYVRGEPICLEIIYTPNGLSMASPATIEYKATFASVTYTSGPLAFDEGNPAEPYGTWGMLDGATVGGHFQVPVEPYSPPTHVARATWSDISFLACPPPTPTETRSWGSIKGMYR